MRRLLRPYLVLIAVLFFVSVSYAGAKKPAGQGGGGGGAKVTTEMCKFTGEDVSSAIPVAVGIDVKTYGPSILLTLSPSLAGEYAGTYWGVARMLKKDGRLDFYFDPSGTNTNCGALQSNSSTIVCPDRLILLDGIYDRKANTVSFSQPARVYLYVDSGVPVVNGEPMDEQEKVTVDFEPYDNQ